MNRLDDAVAHLSFKGYSIKSSRSLSGGVNNSVYELICSDGSRKVLKLYPSPTVRDSRTRGELEISFYKYLHKLDLHNVPSILDYDSEMQWCLITWIDGQRLSNFDFRYLSKVANFIRDINLSNSLADRQRLPFASDACVSLSQVLDSISERILSFDSISFKSPIAVEAAKFIAKHIKPYFESLRNNLLPNTSMHHWSDCNLLYVASPSDIGINNIIEHAGELYFYDFEYAGLDDLSKLASDLIVHPEFPLSQSQAMYFLDELTVQVLGADKPTWRRRVNDLLPIFVVKWSLILLNKLKVNQLTDSQLQKAISYFQVMSCNCSILSAL